MLFLLEKKVLCFFLTDHKQLKVKAYLTPGHGRVVEAGARSPTADLRRLAVRG